MPCADSPSEAAADSDCEVMPSAVRTEPGMSSAVQSRSQMVSTVAVTWLTGAGP